MWLLLALLLAVFVILRFKRYERLLRGADMLLKAVLIQKGGSVSIEKWAVVQAEDAELITTTTRESYSMEVRRIPNPE